jgi:hypothetical protein
MLWRGEQNTKKVNSICDKVASWTTRWQSSLTSTAYFLDAVPSACVHAPRHHNQEHFTTVHQLRLLQLLLQGDVLCCDSCRAVYHLACIGLNTMPGEDEDFYCPLCMCKECSKPARSQQLLPHISTQFVPVHQKQLQVGAVITQDSGGPAVAAARCACS